MKKKLLLVSILALCLAGCGKKSTPANETSSQNVKQENTEITVETVETVAETVDNSDKRIICWGDSMTEGTGGDVYTFPISLEEVSGAEVINYGVFGETTKCIAAREGANPQSTTSEFTIPADCTPVEVTVSSSDGEWMELIDFGDAGINPCTLGGIKGKWYRDDDLGRVFVRETPGEEVVLPSDSPLVTFAMEDKKSDDIWILWTGNNEQPETEDAVRDTISWQRKMLEDAGVTEYIVVSLTSKHMLNEIDLINDMFKEEYGEHYFDLRSYVLSDMLNDAGITPTEEDINDISEGNVPSSLRSDEVHGNDEFYRLTGVKIYEKLKELGYLM